MIMRDGGGQRSISTTVSFVLILSAGVAIGVLLVVRYGFRIVVGGLAMMGWHGFVAVLLIQFGIAVACGIAWFVLVPRLQRTSIWPFVLGRLVRNGASEILLLPHVGGFAMGARAASAAGLPGVIAFASTIVDITMELLAQLAYVTLGLAFYAVRYPGTAIAYSVATSLVVAAVVAIGFVAAQRRGFGVLEAVIRRLGHPQLASNAAVLGDAISEIYSRPLGAIQGFGVHFLCWIAGAAQAWFALKLMRANMGFGIVISIESLLCAARAAAFAVPAALGVQEGAYVVLAGLFGVSPGALLALSLLKRARDAVLGLPPLLVWQVIEAKRLRPRLAA